MTVVLLSWVCFSRVIASTKSAIGGVTLYLGDVLGKVEDEITSPDELRFIDGDPEYFPIIIDYLESVKTCRSEPDKVSAFELPTSRSRLKRIKQEALFYDLKGLAKIVDEKLLHLLAID